MLLKDDLVDLASLGDSMRSRMSLNEDNPFLHQTACLSLSPGHGDGSTSPGKFAHPIVLIGLGSEVRA